ncbi:MAG: DNA/RNA nuclease SfsA [Cellvibrionaceae bacterium]|nr:DNA/RNA nuclease SfsA [Cellvibrionaceae bacterium]
MLFTPPLQTARLLRRYKRFLADIQLPSGEAITIHCANTGAMGECLVEGSPCWYSVSSNPKRKYPCTWEIATTTTGDLAGINTARANALVNEALMEGVIEALTDYKAIKREIKYGRENSRIDFLLSEGATADCYLEVKSVTLGMAGGRGLFPDAVSARGSKHLRELAAIAAEGKRAVLLYCVQHTGIETVSPADHIDPEYGKTLRDAVANGVEVIAYRASISPQEIRLDKKIPVIIPDI